jgi:hypothetical protein
MRSVLAAVVAVVLTAAPAVAQTPASPGGEPTIAKAPASWTYYMAIATIGIAGLTLIMAVLGYVIQAPGFRRGQRSGQTG